MKKILAIILAVMLIASMVIPAYAVTPSFKVPEVPQISKIKFDIKIELPDDYWSNWFKEHPINWGNLFNIAEIKELTRWKQ